MTGDPTPPGPDEVRCDLPAELRHLRLARLAVAAVAADADLTVEEIDDLRVAVDEVCAHLVEATGETRPGARLRLRLRASAETVEVEAAVDLPDGAVVAELHPVARSLLAATVDELSTEARGSELVARLRKSRVPVA